MNMATGKIVTANDSAFFLKTVDAPAGLSSADMRDFARTAIENMSPLPPDSLCCGYFVWGNGFLTLFAGTKDKAFKGLAAYPPDTLLLAPSFALFFGADLGDGTRVIETPSSLCAVEISNGVWQNFFSLPKSDSDETDLKSLEQMTGLEGLADAPRFSLLGAAPHGRKKISIRALNLRSGGETSWQIAADSLKTCDLREESELNLSKKKRMRAVFAKIGFAAIPIIFSILALWQVSVMLKSSKASDISARLAKLEPEAKEVISQSEQIAELSSFTREKLHPVFLLAVVNSLRPDEISFTRVSTSAPDEIEIQGKSPSIGQAMEYAAALRGDPRISEVRAKTESRGEARFTFNIKFSKK